MMNMNKYFYKQLKVSSLNVYVEGAITAHVIGLGSVEWGAGKSKTYYSDYGKPYTAPAYFSLDTNLPFSWIRISIEKKSK